MIVKILIGCAIALPVMMWYVDYIVRKDLDKWDIKEL